MPDYYPYTLNEPEERADPSVIVFDLSAEDMDCDLIIATPVNRMVMRLAKYHGENCEPNEPDEVVYLERKTHA
jgi:hypothetical protein